MMQKFIFDIDGTLTPSRSKIDDEFALFFLDFCKNNHVYLVTGSDKPKTVEQIGNRLYGKAQRVYNCSGADVYEGSKNVHTSDWILPQEAHQWLENALDRSEYPVRTGNHIEYRPGMVNFSVVGRHATIEERAHYVVYDKETNERNLIARDFNKSFPRLQAVVGGETGMDIFPKGGDKSQILKDFSSDDTLYFFGDRMDRDGNDYPLAHEINKKKLGVCHHVENDTHTWKILKKYYETRI